MARFWKWMLTVAAATSASAGSADVAPPASGAPLQHSGKWTVSNTDETCSLTRSYGPPESPTLLGFVVRPMGTGAELRLLERDTSYLSRSDPGELVLGGPDGRTVKLTLRSYGPISTAPGDASSHRLTTGFLTTADVSVRDAIMAPTLTLQRGKAGPPIVIAPGGSAEAIQALSLCGADLMKRMGVDPALQPQLSRTPQPESGSIARWFKSSDYPKQALRNFRFGRTVARLTIGADGSVQNCTVATTSGNPDLDATTCAILRQRGRYLPALDLAGKPGSAVAIVPVAWMPGQWRR